MTTASNEKVRFRLLEMPCCHQLVCWVNPRLPTFCPECGTFILAEVKSGSQTRCDSEAWLRITSPVVT